MSFEKVIPNGEWRKNDFKSEYLTGSDEDIVRITSRETVEKSNYQV